MPDLPVNVEQVSAANAEKAQGAHKPSNVDLSQLVAEYQMLLTALRQEMALEEAQPVEETDTQTKESLRASVFNLLMKRDAIQQMLDDGGLLSGYTFDLLYQIDDRLYETLNKIYTREWQDRIDIEHWRYVKKNVPFTYWWWFKPQNIRCIEDKYVASHENSTALRVFTALFFGAAVCIVVGATIFMIADEQLIMAGLNLILQLALGGLIIAPLAFSVKIFQRLFTVIVDAFSSLTFKFRPGKRTRSSLHNTQALVSSESVLFIVSILLFLLSLAIPRLIVVGANALFDRAVWAVEGGVNLSAGEYYLDIVSRLNPGNQEVAAKLAQLGVLYQEVGRMDKAEDLYQKALANDGRIILALDQLAEHYIDIGDYRQAVLLLNRAAGLLDGYLASPYDDLGEPRLPISLEEAATWYHRVMVTRSRAYVNQGLLVNATQDLDRAIGITQEPNYSHLFVNGTRPHPILMEAFFRSGVVYILLPTSEPCHESYFKLANENFEKMSAFGRLPIDYSREQTWHNASTRARDMLNTVDCTNVGEKDFAWLQELAQ